MANHAYIYLNKKPSLEQITNVFDFINENRFQGLLQKEINNDYLTINPSEYLKTIKEYSQSFGIIINKNNPYLELRHVSGGIMWNISTHIFSALGALLNSRYATDEGIGESFGNKTHLSHPTFEDPFERMYFMRLMKPFVTKIKPYKEINSFYTEFKDAMSFTTNPKRSAYPTLNNKNQHILNETDPYYINPFYLSLTNHIDEYSLEALQKLESFGLDIKEFDKNNLKPVRKNAENITNQWIEKITEPLLFHAIKCGVGIESLKYLTNKLDINIKSNFNQKFIETFLMLPYYTQEDKLNLISHCIHQKYDFITLLNKLTGKKKNEAFIELLVPHIEKGLFEKNIPEALIDSKDNINKTTLKI